MRLFSKAFRTLKLAFLPAVIISGLILATVAIYARKKHREAEEFLDHVDLQARNTSGASFYASKKRLFVGQAFSRNDVVEYLKLTNFVQAKKKDQSGSYVLHGTDTLLINPRLAEFQPVTIRFRRNRIVSINVTATTLIPTSGEVIETTIEPEPLGAFIMSINGDEQSKMFVRRYTIQFLDFENTHLFYAILASEDTLFMAHNGTRFDRILIDLLPGRRGGASSITAQTVKNAVSLDKTHAVTRKIDEMFLASALEQRMSKQEILTLYVNDVFLGGGKGSPNVYGFLAAAEEYFGRKIITELTLSQACTLVAMLPQPNALLNQVKRGDYRELMALRNRVLNRLHEKFPGRYPPTIIEAALKEELQFVPRSYMEQPLDIICRAFIDYAAKQGSLVELENLPPTEYSGLHIYTSADPDLMREGARVIDKLLPSIERRFPPAKPGACAGQNDRMLGAIVALDPQTGEILAMAGGAGGKHGVKYAGLALNAMDAPASAIKPFWQVKALAEGTLANGERYTAASVIDPSRASVNGWRPSWGLRGVGRPRTKLAISADDFATYNLMLIGFENGKKFYEIVTGNNITEPTGELAIGFGARTEVSPLVLARAYTIFGNSGFLIQPNPIDQVYLNGRELELKRKPANQVIDSGAAYITTQMMRSVLGYGFDGRNGTARTAFARTGLSVDNIEMAAKTGSGPYSVWMVSVSPRVVVAVLLTYECRSEIRNTQEMYSRDTAALIWAEFIRSVHRYRPDLLSGSFDRPRNVVTVRIDPTRGCRVDGPGGVNEYFIAGTEPRSCNIP